MSLTVIVVASIIAFALIVLLAGWSVNRAMRNSKMQDTQNKERRGFPRKGAVMFLVLAGLVALLVFVVIPALKGSDSTNGAWLTKAVTPVTFIGESVTQSTDSNGQWSNKCYTYDIGNSWKVASQDPLNIGQTYNIRGQVQQLTDGTIWFIEEARR